MKRRHTVRRTTDTLISSKIIEIYQKIVAFEWLGGVEGAVSDLKAELNRTLGRREPWLNSIRYTRDLDEPPEWVRDKGDWRLAREIRLALDAAIESKSARD
jgi:hypothetical protein